MTLLKFRETPQIGRLTKRHKHIGIREAKAAAVEQEEEEEEEECQRNGNEQRRPSTQTRTALLVEDVLVSTTGRIVGTYSRPKEPKCGNQTRRCNG
jgi:hypothetical protein